MTDEHTDIPALCLTLGDASWEFLRVKGEATSRPPVRLLVHDLMRRTPAGEYSITARGQACLDHARATWKDTCPVCPSHGALRTVDEDGCCPMCGEDAATDTWLALVRALGLVDDDGEATPWGRAVARAGEVDDAGSAQESV